MNELSHLTNYLVNGMTPHGVRQEVMEQLLIIEELMS
jgi:hypothetical protein